MTEAGLTYTDQVICFKELIGKEDDGRRRWRERYGTQWGGGGSGGGWRPVEPFENGSASDSKMEMPSTVPVAARNNPAHFRDSVGDDCLAGGTPKRFGGRWDVMSHDIPLPAYEKQRVVKKGPHDCYCDIGYNCWSKAGTARTANFGLMGTFEREFWTNTPGELALVWDYKGDPNDPKAKKLAELDKAVASR